MKYFKNTELAKVYNISEKSVRNWVDAAQNGKLDLQLIEYRGKSYIANVTKNTQAIKELVEKGKKYRNSRGLKVVRPSEKFYELYSKKQIFDIISNIDIYREIPLQYIYFNSGAQHWDAYTRSLLEQETPNALTSTISLLEDSFAYLDSLIPQGTRVNIVDVGPGNGLSIRNVIEHFKQQGILSRYIGLDISKELLAIDKANLTKWFGNEVRFEGHICDIVYDRFNEFVTHDLFKEEEPTINLVFFLGGTLNNFRQPDRALATIHESMGKNDIMILTKKLDTENARRTFQNATSGNPEVELVLNLLNIDKSYYTTELYFDDTKMARELQAKLNIAINIEFEIDGETRIIELNKDDSILLWRAWHQTAVEAIDQLDKDGFDLMHAARSKDRDYFVHISKIKPANI